MRAVFAIAFLTILATACGGKQYDDSSLVFSSVEMAVPGDATYALVVDLDEESFLAAQESIGQSVNPNAILEGFFPVEEGSDIFSSTGIDVDGGYAVYSRGISPIILARIADGERWDQIIAQIMELNPDLNWSEENVVGSSFHYASDENFFLLLGRRGDFAVARIGINESNLEAATEDLEALFYGNGDVGSFNESEIFQSLAERQQENETFYSYSYLQSEALSGLINVFMEGIEESEDIGAPMFNTEAPEDICQLAEERMLTNYPWFGGIAFSSNENGLSTRSELFVSMARAHAERLQEMLGSAIQLQTSDVNDAAIYVAGHMNLSDIVDSFTADPMAASCTNLGMLPGVAALVSETMEETIDYNLEYFDSDFVFLLQNIEMGGFLPFIHGAIMLSSPDPATIATRIGRLLEAQGASVDPTMGEHGPIFNYRLLHLRITTYLYPEQDRMVMVIGNISEDVIEALATSPTGQAEGAIGEFSWNGEKMREIIELGLQFVVSGQDIPSEELEQIETSLAGIQAIERMNGSVSFEDNMLVFEFFQQLFDAPEEE